MIRRISALVLAISFGAASCTKPPRAAAYFEAHPDETAKVLAACASGEHRGSECENAREGRAAIERNARMERYRRSFQ